MKLKGILATVAAISMMVGCATQVFNPAEVKYDPEASYAKNLAEVFGFWMVKDQTLPKGVSANDGALFDLIGNEALIHAPQGLGLGHMSSLGLSLLFTVGERLDRKYEDYDALVGYVPVKTAKTQREAVVYMRNKVRDIVANEVRKHFPDGRVVIENYHTEIGEYPLMDLSQEWGFIRLVQDDLGCRPFDPNSDDYSCTFNVSAAFSNIYKTPQRIPEWISPKQEMAWFIGAREAYDEDRMETIAFKFGSKTKLYNKGVKYELLPKIAKKLPDYSYIYAFSEVGKDKKRMPRMFVSNKGMHLFIKPEKKN